MASRKTHKHMDFALIAKRVVSHDRLMRVGDVYANSVLTWLENHFRGQVARF